MIDIDGSHGEGGGQVLRTALALAALTGQPTRISRIRAGRRNPGLAPQHLTVVRALASICAADLRGASIGSTELVFHPQSPPRADHYVFDVTAAARGGSAGSVTLIFQAVLFPLLFTPASSHIVLKGGTHVAWSPSFDYLTQVYLATLARIGIDIACNLDAAGFYPMGGGRITADIAGIGRTAGLSGLLDKSNQSAEINEAPISGQGSTPLLLMERGELQRVRGVALVCNLAEEIARRMVKRVRDTLAKTTSNIEVTFRSVPGSGRGVSLCLVAEYGEAVAGFSALGERGKPAERVAEEACRDLLTHHRHGAPVDPHLADQLLLPMALTPGRSAFHTSCVTQHLLTNAQIIRQFIPDRITIEGKEHKPGTVVVD
ncbi:MAG: RNA 3'-terminal phosphate cyclase [Chloroflexales bacterium]|nr:RNA 3'-terminal phosphate cyclase [Chloroflexales bacterium]